MYQDTEAFIEERKEEKMLRLELVLFSTNASPTSHA